MTRLFIVGASGHGREVASVFRDAAASGLRSEQLVGFVDSDTDLQGQTIDGLPVLAGHPAPGERKESGFLLGVGYPQMKAGVIEELEVECQHWPSLIHPTATLGRNVELGRGIVVQAGAVLTVDIRVGDFVTVNVGATISHDCKLGRFSTISPGASLGGNVELGTGAFIGIGASVIQRVRIGPWSVVGAGAVVVEDVPANTVVAGVPARVLRASLEG